MFSSLALITALLSQLQISSAQGSQPAFQLADQSISARTKPEANAASRIAALPLAIEENSGQGPKGAAYIARSGAMDIGFYADRVAMALPAARGERTAEMLDMSFEGTSDKPLLLVSEKSAGQSNYLLGSVAADWHTQIAQYGRVTYKGVYPGVDVTFYGKGQQVEHDFVIQPGVDYRVIRLRYDGARKIAVAPNGDLSVAMRDGSIVLRAPRIYQRRDGVEELRQGRFVLLGGNEVGFRVEHVDPRRELIIDPVLDYSTYLANLSVSVQGVAVDSSGATYVVGETFSTAFPVTSGAFQTRCSSCGSNLGDLFITKLNAAGTAQVYSTYLGGNDNDQPSAIAVDSNGNVAVTGFTASTDFPLKNAIISGVATSNDGFISSLAPDGASLNFSSRLGGSSSSGHSATTHPTAVGTDSNGNVYVSGTTESPYLPVTPGALDALTPAYAQAGIFLSKLSLSGSLGYSAIIGNPGEVGEGGPGPAGIAIDADGDAYLAGTVGPTDTSGTNSWPTTPGAYQSTFIAPDDGAPFVSKVAPDASKLLYSTLLTTGHASAMALTSSGQVIVTGAPGSNYPVTSDAYSSVTGTSFIAKLSADGTKLINSTYFSTASDDTGAYINSLAVDKADNVWIAGYTTSTTELPLVNPIQSVSGVAGSTGSGSAFVSEFDPLVHTLLFSTYFNGVQSGSRIAGIALDTQGRAHIAGTGPDDLPTTPGVFLTSVTAPPANYDYTYGFAALIDTTKPGPGICVSSSPEFFAQLGTSATEAVSITNCGNGPLTISSVQLSGAAFTLGAADSCAGSVAPGDSCNAPITFTPTMPGIASASLQISSNAPEANFTIPLTGVGNAPVIAANPAIVQFQEQVLGAAGSDVVVLVSNQGTAPLVVNTAATSITGNFSITSTTCNSSVTQGAACSYSLSFTPVSVGTSTGTLTIASNDPTNPKLSLPLSGVAIASYTEATVTGFLPGPSIALNSPASTLTITGTNFFPTSYVVVDGEPLSTAYVSSTLLRITLDPSLLTTVGELPVNVVNPAPGGQSASSPLTVYRSLPIAAAGLVYSSLTQMLYAASPQAAASNPNTILPINPLTGAVGTPIPVGTDPRGLVLSDDGTYLYAAVNAGSALQRINMATLQVEATYTLPADPSFGPTTIQDMHVVPGTPTSIVVTLLRNASPSEAGAVLFNDAGLVSFVPSDYQTHDYSPDSFAFTSDPTTIYTIPFANGFFGTATVSATALTPVSSGVDCCDEANGSLVASDGTLLYTNAGQVWNPATKKLLGTYTPTLFYEQSVLADASLQRTFFLDTFNGYNGYGGFANILSFDPSTFKQAGSVSISLQNYVGSEGLVRWGPDGFAFRVYNVTSADQSADQLILVRSGIAHTATGGSPALQSLSPSTVKAGVATLTVMVKGSGFLPGSVVLWNNSARQTTYVSATQLTALLPSTDFATAGTAQVTVSNPAPGSTSFAQSFEVTAVNPPPPAPATVSLSSSSLSFGTQGVGIASSAQQVTVSNTGGSALTGVVISLSRASASSFAQTSTCTTTLTAGASCTVSVVFTPQASGAVQASLLFTDSAAGSPQMVALNGSGVSPSFGVAPPTGAAASVTVTAGQPANYAIALSSIGGFTGPVSLSCGNLPTNATCSFSPAAVNLSVGGSGSSQLTVTTQSGSTSTARLFDLGKSTLGLAVVLLLPITRSRRRLYRGASATAVLLIGTVAALAGCGGASPTSTAAVPAVTPTGSYTISVVATAGGATQTVQVTLNVQ